MDELDQGSVLYGLRSDRYPGIPCYGIVITASCDIANSKVSKIYCLIGVDAKQWFCTEYGFRQAYSQKSHLLSRTSCVYVIDFLLMPLLLVILQLKKFILSFKPTFLKNRPAENSGGISEIFKVFSSTHE